MRIATDAIFLSMGIAIALYILCKYISHKLRLHIPFVRDSDGDINLKDLLIASVGLSVVAFQIPLVYMIIQDDQSLFLGQWDLQTFTMFLILTFIVVPFTFMGLVYIVGRINLKWASLLSISICAYALINQTIFTIERDSGESIVYWKIITFSFIVYCGSYLLSNHIIKIAKLASFGNFILIIVSCVYLYPVNVSIANGLYSEEAREISEIEQSNSSDINSTPIVFLTFEKLVHAYMTDDEGMIREGQFPNLSKFLKSATYFKNAYANSTATVYSLANYYSGKLRYDLKFSKGSLKERVGINRKRIILLDIVTNYCDKDVDICLKVIGANSVSRANLIKGFYKTFLRISLSNSLITGFNLSKWHFNTWGDLWKLESQHFDKVYCN